MMKLASEKRIQGPPLPFRISSLQRPLSLAIYQFSGFLKDADVGEAETLVCGTVTFTVILCDAVTAPVILSDMML